MRQQGKQQTKVPAPSTLMALGRTYLIGVIASYPIVLFFGPFAHFHGNLTLKLFRMDFIRCYLMILRLLELIPSGSLFAAKTFCKENDS